MKNNIAKNQSVMAAPESRPHLNTQNEKMMHAWAQKAFFHPVRVELNNNAKLMLILLYTSLVVFATLGIIHINGKNKVDDNALSSQKLNASEAFQDEEMKTVKIDSSQLAYSHKLLVEQVRSELIKSLDEKEKDRSFLIREKDEKIQLLNARIEKLLVQIEAKNEFNQVQNKNTSYSIENEDILRKEQEIVEKEFRGNQKIQKEAYMGLLDLNKSEDQKKLQAYMNKQQLDIYKLQKAFEKERKEFRTKTFRIASAKSPEDYIKLLEE